jgi:SulP family sulfate permease
MKRMADVTRIGQLTNQLAESAQAQSEDHPLEVDTFKQRQVPAGVQVYEVTGPFFFGAADKVRDVLSVVEEAPRVMILRMRHVPVIDATGLHALEQLQKNCARAGTTLVLCGVHDQPYKALRRGRCLKLLGKENVSPTIEQALQRASQLLGEPAPSVPRSASNLHSDRAA